MKFKSLRGLATILFALLNTVVIKPVGQQNNPYDLAKLRKLKNIVPIAVIGSGPGGLSAAFYGARERFHVVLLEGLKKGGQLVDTNDVENWPAIEHKLGL